MSRPVRVEYPGAVYHVTCRGNEKRNIFRDDRDRHTFLTLLGQAVERFRWVVSAYVLMSNHFHLIVGLTTETLSAGMHWLNTTYAAAFNRAHGRVGHLYQGRFHAPLIDAEKYMLEVIRYVVLNPVRANIVAHPGAYVWSSYLATAGRAAAPPWLAVDDVLVLFGQPRHLARRRYERFVEEGIGNTRVPWTDLVGQIYLGDDQWREQVREKVQMRLRADEHPRSQREVGRRSMASVVEAISAALQVDRDSIRLGHGGTARMIAAWVGSYHGGFTLASIAAGLRIRSRSQVSRLIQRCNDSLAHDARVRNATERCVEVLHRMWKTAQGEV
jgi:putative transposase